MPFASAPLRAPARRRRPPARSLGQVLEQLGTAARPRRRCSSPRRTSAPSRTSPRRCATLLAPARAARRHRRSSVVGGAREVEDEPAVALWAGRLGRAAPAGAPRRPSATPSGDGLGGPAPPTPAAPARCSCCSPTRSRSRSTTCVGELGQLDPPGRRRRRARVGGPRPRRQPPRARRRGARRRRGRRAAARRTWPTRSSCRRAAGPSASPFDRHRRRAEPASTSWPGEPALERLAGRWPTRRPRRARALMRQGLHLGLVVDEHQVDVRPRRLPRPQRARRRPRDTARSPSATRSTVGTTVQFQVRDADTGRRGPARPARRRRRRRRRRARCSPATGGARHLFGEPDHDAESWPRRSLGDAARRHVLRRRDRAGRRAQLPARLHRQRRALPRRVTRTR